MTTRRLQLTIAAGTMAAMMLTISTHAADGGSGTAELTLRMTPLGPGSPHYIPANPQIMFSPDRHRAAVIATQGSRQTVMVDGQAGPVFSKIVYPYRANQFTSSLVFFSPDNQSFTYIGDPDGTRQIVVTDGKQGAAYYRIRWARYSPVGHRLAYAAEIKDEVKSRESKVIVVVDGKPGPAFNDVQVSGEGPDFRFSPDGKRFAYIALARIKTGQFNQTRNAYHTVVDGVPGPGYEAIGGLQFSPDGRSVAYAGRFGAAGNNAIQVVVNGQAGPAYLQIFPIDSGRPFPTSDAIQFSEDGQHFAYVAAKSAEPKGGIDAYVLVVDGQEVAQEAALSHTYETIQHAKLSPDGKRWAYVAIEAASPSNPTLNAFVTIDGRRSSNYTNCTGIVFSPDSRHVAAVVTNANQRQFLVFDGSESDPYLKVPLENLRFSPDSNRYGYVAQKDRNYVVVVDGRPGPDHPYIDPQSLRFSDDGSHFSYTAADHATQQGLTVVDHEVRGANAISSFDGTRRVHVNIQGAGTGSPKSTIILDGQPYGPTFSFVDQLQLSPDGRRVAAIGIYPGTSGQKLNHLFIDGHEGPESGDIMQLVFTPDSRHVVSFAETDNLVGPNQWQSHQLTIDGQAIAEFDRIDIQRTFDPLTNQSTAEGGMAFLPDGTLEFYAVRDETLYRVLLDSSGLDRLPSLEETTAAQPGPRVILDIGSNPQGPGNPHNLAIAPDGTLFATALQGGKYKQGFLFRLNADGSDMQVLYDFLGNRSDGSKPTSLLYGPDDTLYGILATGGQNGVGSIFRVGSDGSGFAAIHHFESSSTSPSLVSVDADGSLYGTLARNKQTLAFRVDTRSNEYSIIYETASASDRSGLEEQRRSIAGSIENYKEMQEQMRPYVKGPDRGQAAAKQAMETYAKNIEQGEAELARIDAQLVGGSNEPIGPMIDGGDGFFYGANLEGVFKLEKSSLEFTRLHTFEGPPLDGQWARTPPMITRDGTLYGLTSAGGIAKGGVIYRLNRDGSGYQVVYNPDKRVMFSANPIEAPDGTVYAVLPTGLHRIGESDTDLPLVDPLGSYVRAENLQFVGKDIFGVAQWGNGRGQIFRYVLPKAGSGSAGRVAVHEAMLSPGTLIVPNDSPDPAQYLFADVTLPGAENPSSVPAQKQVSNDAQPPAKTQQANNPANSPPNKPTQPKEPDKPSNKIDEKVGEAEAAAKNILKKWGL